MIEFKNVTKTFKDTTAVDNLNLTINTGEFISILGPSGCGKSTTLCMLAGLIQPTTGTILIDGQDMTHIQSKSRNIGMVFQDYALYPHMTIFDNIAFPLKMRRYAKSKIKENVEHTARLMNIEHLLNRKPHQLSGGQQQRVAIARAIVREPEILLLDEPLSNLDARLRLTLREEILELQRKLGITTIFVTHDQNEALTMSDKIVMMNEGKVLQYDTPHDIYQHPENIFVASFIGTPPMNLLDIPQTDAQQLNAALKISDEVTLGIRPEHLRMAKSGYPVTVKRIEQTGKDTLVIAIDKRAHVIKFYAKDCNVTGESIYLQADEKNILKFIK
ncbi:ABC transporter ATP-binding protein [Macrococcus equi]|uniref:ABC transporter ATP-binding protein n=1 Tax=Macrococcus equi TaxID=3395462 RepID=UPI0039BE2968